jgi:hypothetical protein
MTKGTVTRANAEQPSVYPETKNTMGTRIRYVLASVCMIALVSAIVYVAYLLLTTPTQIKVTDYDAYRIEALKMVRDEAASFLQIGVAVLGALWATMIVSKDNRLRGDRPEQFMFMVANILLVGFFYFNASYNGILAQLYWDMGPVLSTQGKFADVMNSMRVVVQYHTVLICFYGGLLISAICVFSNCMLRRKE